MSKRALALIAATFVAFFYAANYSVAKNIMPHYVQPFAFIVFRVVGASALFWAISFLGPKEKLKKEHYKYIFLGALFGMSLNMLSFFYGLNLTTPINASVMMVSSPMVTLILAAFFFKEKLTLLRISGLIVGLAGTLIMILYGKGNSVSAPNPGVGNFFMFLNAFFFSCYLIVAKKMTSIYHPFTFIKWMYTVGILIVLPFGFRQVLNMDFTNIPTSAYVSIGYVVVFVTFGTYLLNIFAIKILKPTTVAVFIYFQPLLTTLIAVFSSTDRIDYVKIIAAICIFIGVYLVSKKPKLAIKPI